MTIHEFGTKGKPLIIILHPLLTNGPMIADYFKTMYDKYYIVAPDFSGQGSDNDTFISAEKEADVLSAFICVGRNNVHVRFMFAASLGTAIAAVLLEDLRISFDCILLDGAVFCERKHPEIIGRIGEAVFVTARLAGNIVPGLVAYHIRRNFGPFGDSMFLSFMNTNSRSIANMLKACVSCGFPVISREKQRRMCLLYGEKDGLSCNITLLRRHYPCAHVHVLKGYRHCEYLAKRSGEYMEKVERMLRNLELSKSKVSNA